MAAIELATGYLTLAAETSQLSKQIGSMFRDAENQAGRTGTAIGKSISSGIQSAKPDLDRLAKDVGKAETRIAAHAEQSARKQEAAKRKVEIAQARVNETTKKYGAESSQALRAADQLATAEQRLEAETLAAESAQQKLNTELANAKDAYAAGRKAADEAATSQEKAATAADRIGARMARAWASAKSELDTVSKKLRDVGQKFQDSGKKIGDVGKSLTKSITAPIGGAVTAAAGLVGVLGFKRLTGIDTAQGQIRGLGYDVEAVMEEVDKGVTDTSLSMAEGAAVARSALATGNIEVGKELEDQIKRVANVSAAYGVESSHAGILLNNVLTKNKVTYGDLRQMVDNQIPIISQLAEHYGVTGDEIERMAKDGKISIEDLNKVIDKNAGAAAKEYAGTWEGVTANIRANLGKLGADMLGGVFTELKDEASGFLDLLRSDAAKKFAKDVGERLAEAFRKLLDIGRGVYDWFTGLSPELQKIIFAAVAFAVALGPILVVVGKIAVGIGALIKVIALVTNPIGLVITAVGLLTAALIWFFTKTELGQTIWKNLVSFFQTHVVPAFAAVGSFFVTLWQDHLKPVFAALGEFFQWVWRKIIKPTIGFIQAAFKVWMKAVKLYWDTILHPVFKAIGAVLKMVWDTILRPTFEIIRIGFKGMVEVLKFLWDLTLKPVFNALGTVFKAVWEKFLSPAFVAVRVGFKAMQVGISNLWNNKLKPVFTTLRDFVTKHVVPGFKKGVDAIGKVWDGIKKAAGTPVHFVLETVYNKGIRTTFDKVSSAIGSKARLPKADTSKIPHFAKGGPMQQGWKVVGEEGPELIHTGPGYVYTAEETKKILAGKIEAPQGALDTVMAQGVDIPSHHGVGGFFDSVLGGIGEAARAVGDGIKKSIEWVRGGLAEAAKLVLNPVKGHLKNALGSDGFAGLYSSYVSKAIDGVIDWVRGKDQVDEFGGIYDGPINGFAKPVSGSITSHFGASRGKYPHAGIDFAVPVGTPIRAAWPGVIQRAAWNAVTGRTGMGMLLNHGDRSTYYGHMSKFIKSVGDKVKAGEVIGLSGNTGRSTGPHLHWETWVKGTPVDPMRYLRAGTNKGGKHTATLYDQGGWLPEGTGTMLIDKQVRQPEAVLTNQDWRTAEAAIQATIARDGDGLTAADIRDFIDAVEHAVRAGSREGTATGIAGLGTTVRNNFRKGI